MKTKFFLAFLLSFFLAFQLSASDLDLGGGEGGGGGLTEGEANGLYLKLDQTTLQDIVNGAPNFSAGVTLGPNHGVYLPTINQYPLNDAGILFGTSNANILMDFADGGAVGLSAIQDDSTLLKLNIHSLSHFDLGIIANADSASAADAGVFFNDDSGLTAQIKLGYINIADRFATGVNALTVQNVSSAIAGFVVQPTDTPNEDQFILLGGGENRISINDIGTADYFDLLLLDTGQHLGSSDAFNIWPSGSAIDDNTKGHIKFYTDNGGDSTRLRLWTREDLGKFIELGKYANDSAFVYSSEPIEIWPSGINPSVDLPVFRFEQTSGNPIFSVLDASGDLTNDGIQLIVNPDGVTRIIKTDVDLRIAPFDGDDSYFTLSNTAEGVQTISSRNSAERGFNLRWNDNTVDRTELGSTGDIIFSPNRAMGDGSVPEFKMHRDGIDNYLQLADQDETHILKFNLNLDDFISTISSTEPLVVSTTILSLLPTDNIIKLPASQWAFFGGDFPILFRDSSVTGETTSIWGFGTPTTGDGSGQRIALYDDIDQPSPTENVSFGKDYAGVNMITFRTATDGYLFDQDVEVDSNTNGLILTSPDSSRWRITIDDSGALITTEL